MRESIRAFCLLVLGPLTITACVVYFTQPAATQTVRPLFTVGERIAVVVDCIPVQPPCFTEIITIREIRSDGWLRVTADPQGSEWFVNPSRIYSFQREPVGNIAAR